MRKLLLCFLYALFAAQAAEAIDVNGYLNKAALENKSTDPSTTLTGRVYWNTTVQSPKVYNGTSWVTLGSGAAVSPTAYSVSPTAVTAMGTSTFPPLGHTLDTKDFTATNKAAFWNNFSASNLSDNSGFLQCSSGAAACALTNTGGAVAFGSAGGLTGGTTAASFNGAAELVCSDAFCKPGTNYAAYYAWINPTSWSPGTSGVIFGQYDASANRAFEFYVASSGNLTLNVYPTANTVAACSIAAPVSGLTGWHHVAAVIDSTNLKCYEYLDGKLVVSATMTAPMFASTTSLKIGSEGATSIAFFSGKMEQIGIANGYLMTADDIRKLAARRFDHNKGIATSSQLWSANWARSDTQAGVQLDSSWLVSKSTNSLWADFSGVATGAYVDLSLQNTGLVGTQLFPNSTYDSGVLSTTPATTIAHNLGSRPASIVYEYETSTGHFTPLQGSNFCEADSTNLYCDWTGLSVSASNRLEIIAGGVPLLSAVPLADATTNGIINSNGSQTIGGAKVFNGQVTPSGGIAGATDGSAACTGCVGEYLEATSGSGVYGLTSAGDTWTDASAMGTITATAGDWLMGYCVPLDAINTTSSVGSPAISVVAYDGTSNISGSIGYSNPNLAAGVGFSVTVQTCQQWRYRTTSSKTISLKTRSNGTSANARILGTAITGGLTDPDSTGKIWAVRIH